ncbi:MAG: hypothetical protein WKF78_06845 [Candidatus Limnocylindrales bacterium]
MSAIDIELDESLGLEAQDLAAGRVLFRVEPDAAEGFAKDRLVHAGLFQVLGPLLLEVLVLGARDRRLVDPLAADLGL